MGSSRVILPVDGQLKDMISQPLYWPAPPDVLISCISSESKDEFATLFKSADISMPSCILCPNPNYNDKARAAKFQGSLKFDVVVDERGKAKQIGVVKGDPYGLAARAMEPIKNWKFKPAMKDGKPVTVCVLIEVTFKIF